ncbi:universal stress protein UspA [Mycolicibacterium aromaticivorans JS19b1 = JCM 16368]|uniref:Universal stress protein UspA n=1 Tax=Mycolicibacterium aromaticivorans JS19b1 = JCM 16368 TaxID=1440774 RepID=A0A064CJL6_9MYCO|nr:universal stress protein [Mycolicibacterium aromaticivorans]KDE99836.1 universal stress protein UspA [Mycolicibacterium aromaticivorans JS19b1 = JCM 16368]
MTSAAQEQSVVVGIDGSDASLGAARWAAEFAIAHALPLTLLHAVPRLEWHFAGAEAPTEPGGNGDEVLAAAEADLRSAQPDLVIRTATVKSAVATALADASREARLLVVGSGAADHRVLGGHAVRTVHRAPCPVVVWRAPVAKRSGKPLPVVVGIDDSEASGRALAEAFDIARALHAQLTVVHMWELDAAVGMGDLGGAGNMDWQLLDVLETQQRRRMDELVQPLARKYPDAHVVKVFQDVSPAKGLTDLSRQAQLVVVGSHGRGRLAGSVLGSVGQNLIHHAECPVLVVR